MSEHIGEHIKAVFFDHDDTLVSTYAPKSAHHKHVAKKFYGKDVSDEEIRRHWGKPLHELLCLLYGTDDVEQALKNAAVDSDNFPKELFQATIPTLQHLKSEGKLIGIITSTTRHNLDHDLEINNFPEGLLDYTLASDEIEFHKPDPRVFEPLKEWLKVRHVTPDEVLYIGDGLHDMQAALGAGFSFVGVETGIVTADDFKTAKAVSIPSLEHLINRHSSKD